MKYSKIFGTALLGAVLAVPAIEASAQSKPIVLAQAADGAFRIQQLEEQVRLLNGRVEDMTFQMLEMQELIRKMQEDSEFRFQELEERSDAGGSNGQPSRKSAQDNGGENRLGKSSPSDLSNNGSSGGQTKRKSLTDIIEDNNIIGNGTFGGEGLGAPPAPLGTLRFDENGNLIDSNFGAPTDLSNSPSMINGSQTNLPDNAGERFNLGFQYIQAGAYQQAENVFRNFVNDFPGDQRQAEAGFWLGESLFSLGRYDEAARVFLDTHKQFPHAKLAPQNLLKLGVSLAGLEQRELACATYAEVPKKYPHMSQAVRKRVEIEQLAAKCKNG